MHVNGLTRRLMVAGVVLPAVQGCTAPLPAITADNSALDAAALLAGSAAAHGVDALAALSDLSVRYVGQWHALVGRLQPDLVDCDHRAQSEERLLLREDVVGQSHTGPAGRKQVVRRTLPHAEGGVTVWFDGVETQLAKPRDAAALVADGYSLFLLGPMLVVRRWATEKALLMMMVAGTETITLANEAVPCTRIRLRAAPGLGFSGSDDLELFIGCQDQLMRRVRFTLNGLASTRGAIAEVDTGGHVARHGVQWPTQFRERLLRPLPLAVHDWTLTGLDVDRSLTLGDVNGPAFTGAALAAAAPIA